MSETEKPKPEFAVVLPVRCGSCWHFADVKYKRYKDICTNLGIITESKPCKAYFNNPKSLSVKTETGQKLVDLLQGMRTDQLAALASLAMQERKTRQQGFKFGDKVYVRVYPGEYVSNYMFGRIIHATNKEVFVEGAKRSIRGLFLRNSVLSEEQWVTHRARMVKRNQIIDPKRKEHTQVKVVNRDPDELKFSLQETEINSKPVVLYTNKDKTTRVDLTKIMQVRG